MTDSAWLAEQLLELRAGPTGGVGGFTPATTEAKKIAEVPDLLVHLQLGVGFAAVVVVRRVVEIAVQAAVEVGTAGEARIAPPDCQGRSDVTAATVTESFARFAHG